MKRYLTVFAVILSVISGPSIASSIFRQRQTLASISSAQSSSAPQTAAPRRPRTLEDFDIRADLERSLAKPQKAHHAGSNQSDAKSVPPRETGLLREHPSTQLRWSSLTTVPSRVLSWDRSLSQPSGDDAETTAKRFLKQHQDLFRLSLKEIDELRLSKAHRSDHNGITHLTLQQQIHGRDVFQGEYAIHISRTGEVISASGELIPGAGRAFNLREPRITSVEALRKAAEFADTELIESPLVRLRPQGKEQFQRFGIDDGQSIFVREVEARLVYFPLSSSQIRLAWEFTLWMRETSDVYLMLVDAERGSLLLRYNLTWHCFNNQIENLTRGGESVRPHATVQGFSRSLFDSALLPSHHFQIQNAFNPHGLIYTKDSPRPNVPNSGAMPALIEREDIQFHASPYNESTTFGPNDPHYDWWAGQQPTGIVSNNVDVRLDLNADDRADNPRLTVPDGNFSFPIDLTRPPTVEDNQKSAQVNLFYWANRYHDILYSFGFNEAAGNFQSKNFDLGGLGNDHIRADAQDGSGLNNANYSGGKDGSPGRIQIFLWSGSPQIDGDLDQTIILHELTHGLSTRLVGNGAGLTGTQGRGMGEGWSDYFGLILLRQPEDDLDGKYAIGQYSFNNYYRGIRRFPYSTDPNVYPLNIGDISRNAEIHAVGEIWCNTLIEMRASLIRKYGFREGQRQSIQLVVDGLKLTPISPTFIDARNAILLADRMNNEGANQRVIWQAFSKRGMGFSATTLDANDTSPIEGFDLPPFCNDLGTVRLEKPSYLLGETMKISVGDRNAVPTVRVRVQSSKTGDEEIISLAPDSTFAGNFIGSLRIAAGHATAGDGVLQASLQARDQITVTYDDADDGNGKPAQVFARAEISGEKIILDENVERGNNGWSTTSAHGQSWGIVDTRYASPGHAWTDSPSGNYANNADSSLVSPLLDLSNAGGVTLVFAQSYDFENGFDYGVIEYSTDDGATWRRAAAFTGSQANFKQTKVNLDPLAKHSRARIRFKVISDLTAIADGWYVDDIRVIIRTSELSQLPPSSEFEPVITTITPAFGLPSGESRVTISGLNFTEAKDTRVFFDGVEATSVDVSSTTSLMATTPPHAPGEVSVRIETRHGFAILSNAFTYFVSGTTAERPALINLFPTSGPTRGGTAVILNGLNFTPDTTVSFGTQSANVTFINSNTLRVITPASSYNSTGPVDVVVNNPPTQQAGLTAAFNYVPPTKPTVQLLSPNGGEHFFTGSTITIRWNSADNKEVVKHRIELCRSDGPDLKLITKIANDVAGEAQSFNWKIPNSVPAIDEARIRVVAIDNEGTRAESYSSGDFTIDHRWEDLAEMNESVQRAAVTSDGKSIYVFGGHTSYSSSDTVGAVQRFDPSADPHWTSDGIAAMPIGLHAGAAVYLNGKIYIPGGIDSNNEINSSHLVYEIESNSWSTQSAPPIRASLYALTADPERNVYYLIGGSDLQGAVSNVQIYDLTTNFWSELPSMKTARYAHQSALIGGKLYVAGGSGALGGLSSGEVFDFATRLWSPIADLNRPRQYAVSAVGRDQSGRLFWLMIGGEDATTGAPLDSVEAYDLANNRWILLDGSFSLPTARTRFGSAVFEGFIHAIGGVAQSTGNLITTDEHERFKLDGFTILDLNQPPQVVVPFAPQIAIPGKELKFNVSAEDLGSSVPVTITVAGLPDGATFEVVNETNNSARGVVRWTPRESETGRNFDLTFTASDGQLSDIKSVQLRVVDASRLVAVNAADYRLGPMAIDSIGAAFGNNLAVRAEPARSLPVPLSILDTTLTIDGIPAPLFYVSPTQINFLVPASVTPGMATIIVSNPLGEYAVGNVEIVSSAPSIFTAGASGQGDAAAIATTDGIQYQPAPFDVTVDGKPNILVLFGTGIRRAQAANPNDDNGVAESVNVTIDGQPAQVFYAGAQGDFRGLDQINVEIPLGLAGQGARRVEVIVTVNGLAANRVTIQLK